MVQISDGCALYKGGGTPDNGAFVEVRLPGKAAQAHREALTKAMFQSLGAAGRSGGRHVYEHY